MNRGATPSRHGDALATVLPTPAAHWRRWVSGVLLGTAVLAFVAGCAPAATQPPASVRLSTSTAPAAVTQPTPSPSAAQAPAAALTTTAPPPQASSTPTAQAGTALAALDTLEVKGRAPKTGYSREAFGDGWVDTDRNGCDSRNDVLARDLDAETFKPGTRDCVVLTGTLADPYSGQSIAFVRGQDTSNAVQIDHVVALSDAWQKGAQGWDEVKRVAFANDSLELLAVDGPLNGQKSDGDAATWLPPNTTYRCTYVARQVAIKATWGLWVTAAEKDVIASVLSRCPEQPLPISATATGQTTAAAAPAPAAAPVQVLSPTAAPNTPASPPATTQDPTEADLSYANCAAVRAAGAAPIHTGEPGYTRKLDRDGDGIGCE